MIIMRGVWMRKNFLIVLFCCLYSTFSYAEQATDCTPIDGKCPPGCEGNADMDCSFCSVGTYKGKDNESCIACSSPVGATFEQGENYKGYITDSCPWRISCNAGTYWDGTKCASCYDGYTSDGKSFTGDGADYPEADTHDSFCYGKVYQLTLDKNTLLSGIPPQIRYSNHTAYFKYGTGFSTSENAENWDPDLPESVLQPSNEVKKFLGYRTAKKASGSLQVFDNLGRLAGNDWSRLLPSGGSNTKELYASWENNEVNVSYFDASGDNLINSQTCNIDDESASIDCKVQQYSGEIPNGQVFDKYICRYNKPGTGITSCGDLRLGDNVPLLSTQILLQAVFTDCSDGYYCVEGLQYPCPVGTTSSGGATDVTGCYMARGNNGTKFCDNNGCFYLPGTGKIEYNP